MKSRRAELLNSFLSELCENPFIHSVIYRSPRWHCSANAGERTPPLPLCKHHKLRSATEAAPSLPPFLSFSLPPFLSPSLLLSFSYVCSLTLYPNICLLAFVWLSFPSRLPIIYKTLLFPFIFFSMTCPAEREETVGSNGRKKCVPFPLISAACLKRTEHTVISHTQNHQIR